HVTGVQTCALPISLVRKSNWPGASAECSLMTAPLPWIITVLVASEKGSRLSPPSTVRAPFTATGTSRATGCGLVGGSPGAAEPGRELVSEVASVSESLMIRDIARTPVKQNLRFAR